MNRFFPALLLLLFLAACSKKESANADSDITYFTDFKLDPVTGDTVYSIYMPNAFTPNADGVNDFYLVYSNTIDRNHFSMSICDRSQSPAFSSTDINRGWPGRYTGQRNYAPMGVYSVSVSVKDTSGETHQYNYKILLAK